MAKRLPLIVGIIGCFNLLLQAQDESTVVVNGRRIPSKVVAGQVLVMPEDFAKAIGATVSYSSSGMTITTTASQTASQEFRDSFGVIKGTLSYYSSKYGKRSDNGSRVYLVIGDATILPNELCFEKVPGNLLVYGGGEDRTYKLQKSTISDGNGNFEFAALPGGEYTLIIESEHTKGENYRRKVSIKKVSLKGGDVFDASVDFGVSSSNLPER